MNDIQFLSILVNIDESKVSLLDINDVTRFEIQLLPQNYRQIISNIDSDDFTECYLVLDGNVRRVPKNAVKRILNGNSEFTIKSLKNLFKSVLRSETVKS